MTTTIRLVIEEIDSLFEKEAPYYKTNSFLLGPAYSAYSGYQHGRHGTKEGKRHPWKKQLAINTGVGAATGAVIGANRAKLFGNNPVARIAGGAVGGAIKRGGIAAISRLGGYAMGRGTRNLRGNR